MKKHFYIIGIAACLAFLSCNNGKTGDTELIPVSVKGVFQYINKKGDVVIPPKFKDAFFFSEGLALVRDSAGWGFINKKGKYEIQPVYKSATGFNEGMAWVVLPDKAPDLIDKSGKTLFSFEQAQKVYSFHEGLALFTQETDGNERYGFVDKKGKVVIPPLFKRAYSFSNGLAAVCSDDLDWGFIDKTGKLVIGYQFEGVGNFSDQGYCIVQFDDKYGVINKSGKYLLNPQYDRMRQDKDGFIVHNNEKAGLIDTKGTYLIHPQYEELFPFRGNKVAPFQLKEKWGFVNRSGIVEVLPQFEGLSPLINGVAIAGLSQKIGLVDAEGKYIVNPQYDGIGRDCYSIFWEFDNYYDYVQNDYFDKTFLTAELIPYLKKLDTAYMFYPAKKLLAGFPVKYSDFSSRNKEHLLQTKKINNNLVLKTYLEGSPFVTVSNGWWGTTKKFNENHEVTRLHCVLECSGSLFGKADNIYYALADMCDFKRSSLPSPLEGTSFNLLINDHVFSRSSLYVDTGINEVHFYLHRDGRPE